MIRNIYILASISIICGTACRKDVGVTDNQAKVFIKYFGGTGEDLGFDVKQTADDGYVFTGYSTGSNGKDVILGKTDKYGNLEWQKTFGDSLDDFGKKVVLTTYGYVVVGTKTVKSSGLTKQYVIKTNSNGIPDWSVELGSDNYNELGNDVIVNADQSMIVVGSTTAPNEVNISGNKDFLATKLSANGEIIWQYYYGFEVDDEANSIIALNDGNFLVAGTTSNTATLAGTNIFLVRLKANGKSNGSAIVGTSETDLVSQCFLNDQNEILCLGSTGTTDNLDIYLTKINASFDGISDEYTFGGTSVETGTSIIQTNDGGYAISGTTESEGEGQKDQYLIKLESDFTEEWTQTFGGVNNDEGHSLVQTTDNGFCLIGSSSFENNQMIGLIKTQENGSLLIPTE